MRIGILGGGAAGLYLAAYVKTLEPGHEVEVFERNPADVAYGFGVVFSEQTVNVLQEADPPTYRALRAHATTWSEIEVRHAGRRVSTGGHHFWAITRQQLLIVLQERARAAGARLVFDRDVGHPGELGDVDLLVAADGANSLIREAYRDQFGPERRRGRSNYIWLGSTKAFSSFSFIFEETDAGAFGAHVYPISSDLSTFVVDAGDEALERAGLSPTPQLQPGESDEETLAYLQDVFSPHLDGERLVGNNSRWVKFEEIRNRTWHHREMVLLGDSAHTAHPSVGSGTKMAMEDGIVLARSLTEHSDLPAALTAYERQRRPIVERIQEAARAGSAWWDWFDRPMKQSSEQFVFHYLTRTPRVTRDELAKRDRRLVRRTQMWWRDHHGDSGGGDPVSPLAVPCRFAGIELPNRVGVAVDIGDGDINNPAVDHTTRLAAAVGGAAHWGAGLVLLRSEWADGLGAGLEPLTQAIDFVHTQTCSKLAARVVLDGQAEGGAAAVRAVEHAGGDLLVLASPGDAGIGEDHRRALLEALRSATVASTLPLVAELSVDLGVDADPSAYMHVAVEAARAGAGGLAVAAMPSSMPTGQSHWRLQHLCGLLKLDSELPLIMVGGVEDEDQASTALISGRADVCCGHPQVGMPTWR